MSDPFSSLNQTYSYNAIGNIANKSDIGNYTYTDNGYNNPHAVTNVNGNNYTYDNNGNLTSDSQWTHSWDYRNKLTQSTDGTTTARYAYDDQDNRVSYSVNGTGTTTTVNRYFEARGATSTKYIYAGNELIATVEKAGSSTNTYYNHNDHLGGSNVITDSTGSVTQLLDYYPFGSLRLNEKFGSFDEKKKFTGYTFDTDTNLNYAGARYQSGNVGRFISQDQAYLAVGNNELLSLLTGREIINYLSDPQGLNSYSYVRNNPIINVDPEGNFWWYGFYNWSGYNGISGVMMKVGEVFGGHERAMNTIKQNAATVGEISSKYGVNSNLTNAIIYEEQSHLTPDEALGREQLLPNVGKGGVGVMQVSEKVGKEYGYSKEELARDSAKNINAGVQNIAKEQKRSGSPALTASRYNYSPAKNTTAYGQRIAAQVNNPSYNKNIITDIKNAYNTIKTFYNIIKK